MIADQKSDEWRTCGHIKLKTAMCVLGLGRRADGQERMGHPKTAQVQMRHGHLQPPIFRIERQGKPDRSEPFCHLMPQRVI